MDILSVGGMILAIGSIIGGMILEGGHVGSIVQATAFIIVMGGTIGAVMVNYPMNIFMKALSSMSMVFGNVHVDLKGTIAQKLLSWLMSAVNKGCWLSKGKSKPFNDPLLAKGVQLVVDGTEPVKNTGNHGSGSRDV